MTITDGKRTVEIRMMVWNGTGYGPDWSNDFFNAGLLPRDYDAANDEAVYIVPSVDYCIDAAQDWENEDEDNAVFVDEITVSD